MFTWPLSVLKPQGLFTSEKSDTSDYIRLWRPTFIRLFKLHSSILNATSRDYTYCIYFVWIFWFRHTSISGRMLQFQADKTYSGLLVTVAEATIEVLISAIIEKMITGRFPWLTRWISWFGYYTQLGNQIEPSPGINRMGYIFPMSHIPHPTSMYIVHGR